MYNKPCICNTGGAQKPRRRGYAMDMKIKRNILLNPGPSTTTDTVKLAQVVPDICPREREFADVMADFRRDLLRVVHADPDVYTAVLFCGSGTLNIDVCLNSLLPAGGKVLVVNNGAYSTRAVEICQFYGLPHIDLSFPIDELPDLDRVEQVLRENPDIALVHTTHNETGTGILNPIREIGALAHRYGAVFTVDTTSTLAMRPINVQADNIDFCMASAQKGLMAMTGLSFVIGRRDVIEASRDYPRRSYYCNLWLQYDFFERTGQMHFTPPVQTVYAAVQGLKEYFAEGEQAKWARHTRVFEAIHEGLDRLASGMSSAGNGRRGSWCLPFIRTIPTGTLKRFTTTAMSVALPSTPAKSPQPIPSGCARWAPSTRRISGTFSPCLPTHCA